MKLLASILLVGILVNFGCEFASFAEQKDINLTDLNTFVIGQGTAPSASLFSRQPSEEENEIFHYIPNVSALHNSIPYPALTNNLGVLGGSTSEINGAHPISSFDIIIFQHRLIV